ncbi:MAG: CDGSH iron-sulfur domain-containing protein [Bdellovibrionota bacterium]
MDEPVVAARKPAVLELEPGKYAWCACGKSKNQPWCDGSHRGSPFRPILIELTEKKKVALCQCKHSGNKPYCDGTHSKLP